MSAMPGSEWPRAEMDWAQRHATRGPNPHWQPGVATRLDPYVTRILAPNGGLLTGPGTNTYLVGEREIAVIDPGPDDPAHLESILVAGAGRIRWIVLTHTHPEHAQAADSLRALSGAAVVGCAPGTTHNDPNVELDVTLEDGEAVQFDRLALTAIHTPGHASNHVGYLLSQTRMLFSGDHIVQGSTVVIDPPDGSVRAYLNSLERLGSFDIAVIAPGHGYLIGQPRVEIARLIRHRLWREARVRKAIAQEGGTATLQTLLPRVYADVAPDLESLAQRSLLAHLEKLVADGELVEADGHYRVRTGSRAPDRRRAQ